MLAKRSFAFSYGESRATPLDSKNNALRGCAELSLLCTARSAGSAASAARASAALTAGRSGSASTSTPTSASQPAAPAPMFVLTIFLTFG